MFDRQMTLCHGTITAVESAAVGRERNNPSPALADSADAGLTALVEQSRAGDEAAFRALYRRLTPELLRYAAVLTGQDDTRTGAAVAETWQQLSGHLLRFEGDGPAFRRTALTVARGRAREPGRKRRRSRRNSPHARRTDGLAEPDSAAHEALALVAGLPRTQAEAVLLRVVLKLDNRSAAEILGKHPTTVTLALSRGLRALARRYSAPVGARVAGR